VFALPGDIAWYYPRELSFCHFPPGTFSPQKYWYLPQRRRAPVSICAMLPDYPIVAVEIYGNALTKIEVRNRINKLRGNHAFGGSQFLVIPQELCHDVIVSVSFGFPNVRSTSAFDSPFARRAYSSFS